MCSAAARAELGNGRQSACIALCPVLTLLFSLAPNIATGLPNENPAQLSPS